MMIENDNNDYVLKLGFSSESPGNFKKYYCLVPQQFCFNCCPGTGVFKISPVVLISS